MTWGGYRDRHSAMRAEYPGAIYQVMDPGDCPEDIFINNVDRQDFLEILTASR